MTRFLPCLLAGLGALALASCASAPVRYYTLVAPPATTAAPTATKLAFELLPVSIPAQVDRPQLVVRSGEQDMQLLNGERWIAPLADEVHAALAADLAQALPGRDVGTVPAAGTPRLRIKLDVQRFDSQPGQDVLLAGTWSVRKLDATRGANTAPVVVCTDSVREAVDAGYPALVAGHQRALAQVAAHIARAARAVADGQPASCPAS